MSKKECPICHYSGEFGISGYKRRKDAKCGGCGSLERDRLIFMFFCRNTDLFDDEPKTMLHISPASCLQSLLRGELLDGYITAALPGESAQLHFDLTRTNMGTHTLDVIYASHVLEHIKDDTKAMHQLFRILKVSGWAVLNVPIVGNETLEGEEFDNETDMLRKFGHSGHYRSYGEVDYIKKLKDVGFCVEVICVDDVVTPEEMNRFSIPEGVGAVYYCKKV